MCKSNQHLSTVHMYNLTLTRKQNKRFYKIIFILNFKNILASMKIFPKDGILELNPAQRSINLSCTVRELPTHTVDPLKLKWYQNKRLLNHHKTLNSINKNPMHNQLTSVLHIHHLGFNDSGLFQCVYNEGLISKDVEIFYTSGIFVISCFLSTYA